MLDERGIQQTGSLALTTICMHVRERWMLPTNFVRLFRRYAVLLDDACEWGQGVQIHMQHKEE